MLKIWPREKIKRDTDKTTFSSSPPLTIISFVCLTIETANDNHTHGTDALLSLAARATRVPFPERPTPLHKKVTKWNFEYL